MGTATTTDFLSALRQRRSLYALKKGSPISDERIRQLLEEALTHTPSAFNSQTTRLVLLLGAEHDRLWEITREVLKAIVPEDQFAA
ncbi:MAG: nitroreductase family protein, partial [Sulfobacillus sp.]|nr:nitroreductase family protein [Sulfobacillus sp.]